jgi:rhamnose utilization protein RhaD (predicted bifunctional aldolase and dehydrogenase)
MEKEAINKALSEFTGVKRDYFDLNAMHEAEKQLNPSEVWVYRDILMGMVIATQGQNGAEISTHFLYGATAAQRAEALLRTINKWQTEKEPTK